MTFNQFNDQCNDRASDDRWGLHTVRLCIEIIENINATQIFYRKKKWKSIENDVIKNIVTPVNLLIGTNF